MRKILLGKSWPYIIAMLLAVVLLAARSYNVLQRTIYSTQEIYSVGAGVQIYLSYPARIAGPEIDASYLLVVKYVNRGNAIPAPVYPYEIVFEAPTLLFTDSKGGEISPRVQFSGEYGIIQKSIYIRPFPSGQYSSLHRIFIKVLADGKEITTTQPNFIDIENQPTWLSYINLYALDLSILLGLFAFCFTMFNNILSSRKELVGKYREEAQKLAALPLLERMRKFIYLKNETRNDKDFAGELQQIKKTLCGSEREFIRAIGESLQQEKLNELTDVETLHGFFFEKHKDSISALATLIMSQTLKEPLSLISDIVKLWDDFDADAKDLIALALNRYRNKIAIHKFSKKKLESKVFVSPSHRRLLRSEEIRKLFPQLGPPSPNYDATWRHLEECQPDSMKMLNWLKQHGLASNPFGCNPKLYPAYPENIARPDLWESFVLSPSSIALSSTAEDVFSLAILLRRELLSARQTFPILISLREEDITQSPLVTLARTTSRTWLDILSLSPDALLDLSPMMQEALLELLCWSFGAKETLAYLLQESGLKEDVPGSVLRRKIAEFESHISLTHTPQDQVLLSWLKIRPPDLGQTSLILHLDGNLHPLAYTWLAHFSLLIPLLLHNKITTKAIVASPAPISLSLPSMQLSWSDNQLRVSLFSQFINAATRAEGDIPEGDPIQFRDLFGLGVSEEETTEKLIFASRGSLSHMLRLGNQLLQKHCESEKPEKYLSPEELGDILKRV